MNKTGVDDMLIEMITPKIREIEEKFSKSGKLEQEDINTLLLKSQYNHINHLDQKLNEITSDVSQLRQDFKELEHKFENLENKFENLENKFEGFKSEIELTIQKALNKNMLIMLGGLGFFTTLFKLIDAFTK